MKFSSDGCVLLLSLSTMTTTTYSFLPSHQSVNKFHASSPLPLLNIRHDEESSFTSFSSDRSNDSSSSLNMAFKSHGAAESNMFDGPMALTKERDACGVGFVANTQSGGK